MSNQDSDTTAAVSSPASGLPTTPLTAPWSRKRRRQESAVKLRQKKRLVEQTDATRPGSSSASTSGSSDQDLLALLTPASVPRVHDRDHAASIITPAASDLPYPQTSPSPQGDPLPTVDDSTHAVSSESPASSVFSPQSLAWSRKRISNKKAELVQYVCFKATFVCTTSQS